MIRLARLVPPVLRGNGLTALWLRAQLRLLLLIAFVVGVLVAATLAITVVYQQTSDSSAKSLAELRAEWPVLRKLLQDERRMRPTVARWLLQYGVGAIPAGDGKFVVGPNQYSGADLVVVLSGGRRIDPFSDRDLGPEPASWRAASRAVAAANGLVLLAAARLPPDERPANVLLLPINQDMRIAVITPARWLTAMETATLSVQVFLAVSMSSALLLIILAVLVGSRFARREAERLTAPLQRLEEAAHALAMGRLDARVQVGGADETHALGLQFNAMSAALERSVADLQTALDSRSRLLADISHELRTPLTLVIGHAERLERVPEAKRDAAVIMEASLAIKRLLHDLMGSARMEVATLGVLLQPIDVAATAASVVEAFTLAATRAGLQLGCEAAPAVAMADAERLRQVLSNLLANALRYTPRGGRVLVRVEQLPAAVVLQVIDTGIGMDTAAAGRAFDRGFSLREGEKSDLHGLGLAISKRLVEAMGGRIVIDSQPNAGTTVTLALAPSP